MYNVILIKPDGSIERSQQAKKPDYEQIRKAVEGYIEYVPHFSKFEDYKRGEAIVNEEGFIKRLPFNRNATDWWLKNLGKGLFTYEPRLYGNMLYICKEPKKK